MLSIRSPRSSPKGRQLWKGGVVFFLTTLAIVSHMGGVIDTASTRVHATGGSQPTDSLVWPDMVISPGGDPHSEWHWRAYDEARRLWERPGSTGDAGLTLVGELPWGWCYAVAQKGNFLFVGNGLLMQVLEILPNDSLRHVTEARVMSTILDMYRDGNRLYVIDYWGLHIFEISRPAFPVLLGQMFVAGAPPFRVVARDTLVFLTTFYHFAIVRVADPSQPQLLSSRPLFGERGFGLAVRGNYAYCASQQLDLFQIYDITDPANPVLLPPPETYPGGVTRFLIRDSLLFSSGTWLYSFSLADPAAPVPLDSVRPPDIGDFLLGMALGGDRLYLSSSSGRILTVDITDPGQLTVIASQPFVHRLGTFPPMMVISAEDQRLRAAWQSRLLSFSITAADSVTKVGQYVVGGQSRGVRVKDGYAYIASSLSGLWVVDAQDPTRPIPVGRFETRGNAHRIEIRDSLVFLLHEPPPTEWFHDAGETVWILSITDPVRPIPLANFTSIIHFNASLFQRFLWVEGSWLYLVESDATAGRDTLLAMLDVSDPSAPLQVGIYRRNEYRVITGVAAWQNQVYLPLSGEGIRIIDVSNPSMPLHVGTAFTHANSIGTNNGIIFTRVANTFASAEVTKPSSPIYLDSIPISGQDGAPIVLRGNRAYFTAGQGEFYAVDVSNPASMQLRFTSAYHSGSFDVDSPYVYFANLFLTVHRFPAVMDVKDEVAGSALAALYPNFPNPFNRETTIRYYLPQRTQIRMELFDVLGRRIQILVDGVREAGEHQVRFDSSELPSGIYLCIMNDSNGIKGMKLMHLR